MQKAQINSGAFLVKCFDKQPIIGSNLFAFYGEVIEASTLSEGAFVQDHIIGLSSNQFTNPEDANSLVIDSHQCARIPPMMNKKKAVGFIMDYAMLWYALFERTKIEHKQKVLILVSNQKSEQAWAQIAAEIVVFLGCLPVLATAIPPSDINTDRFDFILLPPNFDLKGLENLILSHNPNCYGAKFIHFYAQDNQAYSLLSTELLLLLSNGNHDLILCNWINLYQHEANKFFHIVKDCLKASDRFPSIYDDPNDYVDPDRFDIEAPQKYD